MSGFYRLSANGTPIEIEFPTFVAVQPDGTLQSGASSGSVFVEGIGESGDSIATPGGGDGELIPQAKRSNAELLLLNTTVSALLGALATTDREAVGTIYTVVNASGTANTSTGDTLLYREFRQTSDNSTVFSEWINASKDPGIALTASEVAGIDVQNDLAAEQIAGGPSTGGATANEIKNAIETATTLDGLETALGDLKTELALKANLAETQPVSLASSPLPTGAATEAKQDTLITNIGSTSDTAATTDTGSFSFISLFKRILSRLLATRSVFSGSISTAGDNVIIADVSVGVAQEVVVTYLLIQNATGNEALALLESGEASATEKSRLRTETKTSGLAESYSFGDELVMDAGEGFVINLDVAEAHDVVCRYYLRDSTTKLPV